MAPIVAAAAAAAVQCMPSLQALTTSVALWYGLEAFKLRSQVVEEEEVRAGRNTASG
jgi:hypothetical protein